MTWIQTATGQKFDYRHPDPATISADDIAAGLSRHTRWSGQYRIDVPFYSVAQHSVHVSRLCERDGIAIEGPGDQPQPGVRRAWLGLFHDASEAYMGDLCSPLKVMLADYKTIEAGVSRAIARAFRFPAGPSAAVKYWDAVALATEYRDLLLQVGVAEDWVRALPAADPRPLEPLDPEESRCLFLARYQELLPRYLESIGARPPAATLETSAPIETSWEN